MKLIAECGSGVFVLRSSRLRAPCRCTSHVCFCVQHRHTHKRTHTKCGTRVNSQPSLRPDPFSLAGITAPHATRNNSPTGADTAHTHTRTANAATTRERARARNGCGKVCACRHKATVSATTRHAHTGLPHCFGVCLCVFMLYSLGTLSARPLARPARWLARWLAAAAVVAVIHC